MAHTSTARRRFGAALSALGVGIAATAALVGMAGTASAHTPNIKAECTDNGTVLKVHLSNYMRGGENSVQVMDGDTVLLEKTTFSRFFNQTFDGLDATVEHTFTVDVKAWDDPNGDRGFTKVLTARAEACVETPPTSSSSEEVPPTSSEAPPTSSEEVPPPSSAPATTTTTTTEVQEAALAETGASVALPLGIAAVLLVGGGVLLFVVRRRSRA